MLVSGQGANMIQKSTVATPRDLMMLRPISTRSWYQIAYLFSYAANYARWRGSVESRTAGSYAMIVPERVDSPASPQALEIPRHHREPPAPGEEPPGRNFFSAQNLWAP